MNEVISARTVWLPYTKLFHGIACGDEPGPLQTQGEPLRCAHIENVSFPSLQEAMILPCP